MNLTKVDYPSFSTQLNEFFGNINQDNTDGYLEFLKQNFTFNPKYAQHSQTLETMKRISGSLTGDVQRRVIRGVAGVYKTIFPSPFPTDVLKLILSYLPPKNLRKAAQVSIECAAFSRPAQIDWINTHPLSWRANNPSVFDYNSKLPGYKDIEEVLAFFGANPDAGPQIVNLDLTYLNLDARGLRLQEKNLLELLRYCPKLRGLNLRGCLDCDTGYCAKKCFDSVLVGIGGLLNLESLNLTNSLRGITDEGLKPLAGLTSLRELRLDQCNCLGSGLGSLGVLPALETLSFSDRSVVGKSLAQFHEQFPNLKRLEMSRCPQIGAKHVSLLVKKNGGLRDLDISNNDWVTDELIGTIVDNSPHLRSLKLWGINLATESFQKLAKLLSLEKLELGLINDDVTMNSILSILIAFPNLRSLRLSSCTINDEGLRLLATIPGLEVLTLASCEGMSSLSRDKDPHGIPLLASLETLRELNITDCRRVCEGDVEALRKAQQDKGILCTINWQKA